jgi:hypothetical protein
MESKEDSDSRILGNRGFIERVLRDANEMDRPREKKGRIPYKPELHLNQRPLPFLFTLLLWGMLPGTGGIK